jgi:hypothetical protein
LVRWKGDWGDQQTTWQLEGELEGCEDAVRDFWTRSGLDEEAQHDPPAGEHRCRFCCKTYSRAQDLKAHGTRGCKLKPRSRAGTRAERAVKKEMVVQDLQRLPSVCLEGKPLKKAYNFKYLGFGFQGDGDIEQAMLLRMGLAKAVFGNLRHLWDSDLSTRWKLRLFRAGVVSILVYGLEAWEITERAKTRLRGWASRCLVRITGRTYREEAVDPTWDLVRYVLARRLRWLGHTLRRPEGALVRRTVLAMAQVGLDEGGHAAGSLLAEAPAHSSVEELVGMAEDRDWWRGLVKEAEGV